MEQRSKENVLRVATTIVAQHFSGFISEAAKEIARRMGASDIEWVLLPFDKLFSADHAPFDFAAQVVTITPERREVVDFSDPYMQVDQGLLVMKDGPMARASSVEDVRDHVLGARAGGTGMICIEDIIRPTKPPLEYQSAFVTGKALTQGEIEGGVLDAPVAIALSRQFPETTVVGRFATNEQYGILFDKGSPLRERVNRALSDMRSDGTWVRLTEKWFPGIGELPELT